MSSFRPRLVIGAAAVIAVILIVSLVQEMNRRWQVQREVQALEQEVNTAEQKVIELGQLNQYFRTDAFQERVARENLNYSAPGEKVVLIPEDAQPPEVASSAAIQQPEIISVPMKWWRIFFVEQNPFEAFHNNEAG